MSDQAREETTQRAKYGQTTSCQDCLLDFTFGKCDFQLRFFVFKRVRKVANVL